MTTPKRQPEDQLIEKCRGLNYKYRSDIRDRIQAAQIELKTLGITLRRAIKQIVEYRNNPGKTRPHLAFAETTSAC